MTKARAIASVLFEVLSIVSSAAGFKVLWTYNIFSFLFYFSLKQNFPSNLKILFFCFLYLVNRPLLTMRALTLNLNYLCHITSSLLIREGFIIQLCNFQRCASSYFIRLFLVTIMVLRSLLLQLLTSN